MTGFVELPGAGQRVETEDTPAGTKRQRVTVADVPAEVHYALDVIAAVLSLAIDPSTGRLRTSQEANSAANQSTNIAQVNGVAINTANGTAGTGTIRTTLAADSALVFDLMATAYGQLIRPRIA